MICYETGETYKSKASTAEQLDVPIDRLDNAIEHGYLLLGRHFYIDNGVELNTDLFKPYYGRHDAIECIETGKRFETYKAAALAVGLKHGTNIAMAIKTGGTCGGYHWKHCNEDIQGKKLKKPMMRGVPVRCIETGEEFKNITDAAISVNADPSLIRDAIRRQGTSRGYHWEYVGDAE